MTFLCSLFSFDRYSEFVRDLNIAKSYRESEVAKEAARQYNKIIEKQHSGAEGLEAAKQNQIHLAILDIMMPVMDGVTMLMRLRSMGQDFPVIMLSAKSEEVDKIMDLNMGADDYVTV